MVPLGNISAVGGQLAVGSRRGAEAELEGSDLVGNVSALLAQLTITSWPCAS